MVNEQRYDRTVVCLDQKDYDGALQAQAGTFMFYRDTRDLYAYLKAGSSLKKGGIRPGKGCLYRAGHLPGCIHHGERMRLSKGNRPSKSGED